MKKTGLIAAGILLWMLNTGFSNHTYTPGKTTLSGKITDKNTGEPLPGVSIYIPDLKTGTTSGLDGSYKLENLPQAIVLVKVSMISYKLIAEIIDLSKVTTRDFVMEETVAELNEVVVTGLSRSAEKNRTPSPITTISPLQLKQITATNLVDALATQPGISQVTTGAGISKPVIRGLGYNRVLVVNDGIRQEGQQWGDEHGIEIDEFAVNQIEILKGPASLSYGSDALAGVINVLPAPTLPEGKIQGTLYANYQTNNGLAGLSLNLAGNRKGFIWDVRYSQKIAHDYQNKFDDFVHNSGFRENAFSGIAGLNRSWGYLHLHFSLYGIQPGMVNGERDSATGHFIKPVAWNDSTETTALATNGDFHSYWPSTPYQKINHNKLVLHHNLIIRNGSLKTIIGWQQNQRQEYADILDQDQYGLYFLLNTFHYDIRYNFPEVNRFTASIGANGMLQQSQNKGHEFLIPEYHLFDIGISGIVKKSYERLDLSGGLRYDSRTERGSDLFLDAGGNPTGNEAGSVQRFSAFHYRYSGLTGSLGATLQFSSGLFTKLNLSRGFRAPNIAEISAHGVHEGSLNYIIGVPSLKAESSFQLDYALGMNTHHLTAEVDLFYNDIRNFIYMEKLSSQSGGDSITEGNSTFRYASGHAGLYGGEFSLDMHPHPLDWLHFENTFSLVHSVLQDQPDSSRYLPFTPGPKFASELRATKKRLGPYFANAFVRFGLEYYFKQDRYFAAYQTETATPGYTLLHLGAGADIVLKARLLFSLFISINNVADVAYQSHLSRLKYAETNVATGRNGVFNMGRNISIKLIVPFDIKKSPA